MMFKVILTTRLLTKSREPVRHVYVAEGTTAKVAARKVVHALGFATAVGVQHPSIAEVRTERVSLVRLYSNDSNILRT